MSRTGVTAWAGAALAWCVVLSAAAPAGAAAAEKRPAKPAAQKIEKLACVLGTEDSHARIAVEMLNGRVNRFAYYGYLTIRRANPKCELDGLMEQSPVAE